MSIYKPANRPFYYFDFEIDGQRFHGSTKTADKRKAQKIEDEQRDAAIKKLASLNGATVSLLLDDVAGRYWLEVGQHHSGARNTHRDLARLIGYFGRTKLLSTITDHDIATMVAWRRSHKSNSGDLVSSATVNRSTTEVLRKLFTHAKDAWGVRFLHEPRWRKHVLKEPQERVRELHPDEADRLLAATRDDYRPLFAFMRASGLRKAECYELRWSEVHWSEGQIIRQGKGDRRVTVPLTAAIRAIIEPLRGQHEEFVFTYIAARTRDGRKAGARYPFTENGLDTAWRRLRKRAGVTDFRQHDFRHDFGSKLLRETGNLKLVQRALNHRDIASTVRYAHVLDADVAAAMQKVAEKQPQNRGDESRQNPDKIIDTKTSD